MRGECARPATGCPPFDAAVRSRRDQGVGVSESIIMGMNINIGSGNPPSFCGTAPRMHGFGVPSRSLLADNTIFGTYCLRAPLLLRPAVTSCIL